MTQIAWKIHTGNNRSFFNLLCICRGQINRAPTTREQHRVGLFHWSDVSSWKKLHHFDNTEDSDASAVQALSGGLFSGGLFLFLFLFHPSLFLFLCHCSGVRRSVSASSFLRGARVPAAAASSAAPTAQEERSVLNKLLPCVHSVLQFINSFSRALWFGWS